MEMKQWLVSGEQIDPEKPSSPPQRATLGLYDSSVSFPCCFFPFLPRFHLEALNTNSRLVPSACLSWVSLSPSTLGGPALFVFLGAGWFKAGSFALVIQHPDDSA